MPLETGMRIGRIRVDALLGAGGMGEVWRGWDEKLERAVALKVIHADKRVHAFVRARFLREARVLSQLDHPNICRIYDVLERDDGDYLVLELVEGTTLRARIEAGLTKAEALDVALQVARVLAVTHARGIVHRDLKPENIMLTPQGQVKVLDFGLARPVDPMRVAAPPPDVLVPDDMERTAVLGRTAATTDDSHTSAGSLVGTLHYMSPEQAHGLPIAEASDVYSLGIVLYEMLAPGRGAYGPVETPPDLLVLVRKGEVAPYDFHDRALESLLKRMLALHPADRADAATAVRELEAIRERPARVRRRMLAGAALLLVVALIAGASFLSRRTPERLFAASHGRIAILPFRNETGDASLKWIETGLTELVIEGTRRARGADVVAAEEVARAMERFRGNRGALMTALGADVLIEPVVTQDEGKYTIRYAALRPDRAETPREATSTVLVEAARQMSVDLAQRIDPSSAADVRARMSLDATANMLFAMGMQELRTRGPKVAAHYFTVCLDRDPEFLAAKVRLAECRQAMAEHEAAARLMDEAMAQARARNDREGLLDAMIGRGRWKIDSGDYKGAEASAREALQIARGLGDRELHARALSLLGHASWRMGRLDEARTQFDEGLRIAVALHDVRKQAQFHNNLGVLADSIPDPALAEKHFTRAAALADRMNDRYLSATIVGNLAGVYAARGDFARAEEMTRRQIVLTREIGDTASSVYGLVNRGLYLWAQGKEREAVAATREAAAVAAQVGNPRVEAVILANLGVAETKLGDLEAARAHNAAALQKLATLADPEVARDVHLALAYTAIRGGALAEAERWLDRAEAWRVSDRCHLYRARLAYARGDYARAWELVKKAKATADVWLIQSEQMYRAFEESARTQRPASAKFEERLPG
ncbi:MAG TPA: protein kinase [Thermoanaerobaculia bacterium]|nr:protein kinase [Thermoanaerobaculia bacterium]